MFNGLCLELAVYRFYTEMYSDSGVSFKPRPHTGGGTALLDLSGLDTSPQSPPSLPEFPTPTDGLNAPSQEMGISLLDDELMSLGNGTSGTSHFNNLLLCMSAELSWNYFALKLLSASSHAFVNSVVIIVAS